MAWLSGWSYRKEISITGQSGVGTNYQAKLNIGDSAGGDFHLEGHCTNFPQDVEVTDDDGTTLLDFWIEDTTADPIKLWVEVADDLGSNQKVWVYYGKSGASSNTDIEATFLLGDDFPGSSLDSGKWSGSATVSGSKVTVSGSGSRIDSILNWGYGHAVIGYGKVVYSGDTQSLCEVGFGSEFVDSNALDIYQYNIGGALNAVSKASGSSSGGVSTGDTEDYTYKRWEIRRVTDVLNEYQIDTLGVVNRTTNIPSVNLSATLHTRLSNDSVEFDWIVVRKYNSPEPAFSSAGSEETPPTGASPTAVFYGPFVGPLGGPI